MNTKTLELLREWIQAEIDYSIASDKEDYTGDKNPAYGEKSIADSLFIRLMEVI